MKLRIAHIEALSPAIKRIAFAAPDGAMLPAYSAGAHIMLEIPGPGRVWKNAYSLVSPPTQRAAYDIVVRRVEPSRGGSAWLHDHATPGQELEVGLPTNLFPIARLAAKHLLLSAGIGLTPFLSYLPVLRRAGRQFELHQICREAEAAAFAHLLPAAPDITLHTSRNTLDVPALLARQHLDTHLYVCGPSPFMETILNAARALGWPDAKIHSENFGGATGGAPFTAHLQRSGITVQVAADESLLEAMEAAGIVAPSLCRGGACGECALPVLAGIPDHRDHVLSAPEHAANTLIMTCVSRARTPELVLDF
jgi:ferredoxin-NADP reductase